jgi:hypothetical protein
MWPHKPHHYVKVRIPSGGQNACAVLYCDLCHVRIYSVFPHYLINGTIFGRKVLQHTACVLIFSTTFVWNIAYCRKDWAAYYRKCTYIGLYVRYALLLSDYNESWIFCADFRKILKFYESPSSGSAFVPDRRTYRQTGIMKPIAAFRNFANAPENGLNYTKTNALLILRHDFVALCMVPDFQSQYYVIRNIITWFLVYCSFFVFGWSRSPVRRMKLF